MWTDSISILGYVLAAVPFTVTQDQLFDISAANAVMGINVCMNTNVHIANAFALNLIFAVIELYFILLYCKYLRVQKKIKR